MDIPKFFVYISIFLTLPLFAQERFDVVVSNNDGTQQNVPYEFNLDENNSFELVIPKDKFGDKSKTITIYPEFAKAMVGDKGYFLSSFGSMTKFLPRERPLSLKYWKNIMPIHMTKTPQGTYMAFVKGMRFGYEYCIDFKDNIYTNSIRFDLEKNPLYEDIIIKFIKFPDFAEYPEIAKYYRNVRLEKDGLKTLKEKIKTRSELAYCVEAPEVRIMIGMKPQKKTIEYQTIENEPKMDLWLTFDEIGMLLDALKSNGVEKAKICLVGWNQKGHDGRYPQLFPVEESAGGEEALRRLIKKGQEMGYQMTCHTCSTDGYTIADCWNDDLPAITRDGKFSSHSMWSGGKMHNLCLKQVWKKKFPQKDFKALADLGFKGIHYIDVLTAIYPFECFSKEHRMTPSEGVKYAKKIAREATKNMGGVYSEGGVDFAFDVVDGCIWVYAEGMLCPWTKLVDNCVPFWQIVYNGIVFSTPWNKCPYPDPNNPKMKLKFFEYVGRPRCEFAPPLHKMTPDKQIEAANKYGKKMKGICDEFQKISKYQLEFIDDHREISQNVTLTKLSDGTEIVCNHSDKQVEYRSDKIAPLAYKIYENTAKTN